MKCAKRGSKRIKTHNHLKHGWHDAHYTVSHEPRATLSWVRTNAGKCDVWGCSVHTPRRLQQIAVSFQRSCYNIFSKQIMSSTNFHSTATMRYWKMKKTNATFGIDEKRLVQVVLLQIHGGDSSWLWLVLGSRIEVASVHFCLICSVRFFNFCDISRTPQRMGNRSGFPVLICPSRCTSTRSSQFWVANHDILNLVGRDREFHQISYWDISSAHCGPRNALPVPQFCRAEHHEVAPSW